MWPASVQDSRLTMHPWTPRFEIFTNRIRPCEHQEFASMVPWKNHEHRSNSVQLLPWITNFVRLFQCLQHVGERRNGRVSTRVSSSISPCSTSCFVNSKFDLDNSDSNRCEFKTQGGVSTRRFDVAEKRYELILLPTLRFAFLSSSSSLRWLLIVASLLLWAPSCCVLLSGARCGLRLSSTIRASNVEALQLWWWACGEGERGWCSESEAREMKLIQWDFLRKWLLPPNEGESMWFIEVWHRN